MPELELLAFVRTRGKSIGNDVLEVVEHEVRSVGVPTVSVATERIDDYASRRTVFVTVPQTHSEPPADLCGHEDRIISLCVEYPGTSRFEHSANAAARTPRVFDVSRAGTQALRERGLAAEHLQLGYSEYLDAWGRDASVARPIDVVHLDTEEPRRLAALAFAARALARHRTEILLPRERAEPGTRANALTGRERRAALGQSKVLLHVHRQAGRELELLVVLEAICNGCVVVCEWSAETGPLVGGEHVVMGASETLGDLSDDLLQDEAAMRRVQLAAYDVVRREMRMTEAVERLAAVATSLASKKKIRLARRSATRHATVLMARRRLRSVVDGFAHRHETHVPDASIEIRERAGEKAEALESLRRARERQEVRLRRAGVDPHMIDELARTPTYGAATPRVSVLIPLYNHAAEVVRALESVANASYGRHDVIVLDDASTDDSREVVRAFFVRHPELPGRLLGHRANRGLGRTRNALVGSATGELVFPLDADNELYPRAIVRLVEALDENPEALFSYSAIEVHDGDEPVTLMSHQPWDQERLRWHNYIDAMAMIRRRELIAIGGYTEDPRLHGWEDYDLWCRVAANGGSGVHVPEILLRYLRAEHSMISLTDIDTSEARRVLRESYPATMVESGSGVPRDGQP